MTAGTLSRFLSGEIDKLSADNGIAIARIFQVSTDFLMSESDGRGRIHYDIAELGLSVQAARNLYTGWVASQVVSLLLENPQFGLVTELASEYFSDAIASGNAALHPGTVLHRQRNGESTKMEQPVKGHHQPGGAPG